MYLSWVSGWLNRELLVWVGEKVGGERVLGWYEARAGII